MNLEITLSTPYGTPEAIYLNIMVPLMHLLAFVMPRQASPNSYSSPFLVRACVPGYFSCDMGIIDSMEIQKGGSNNDQWSVYGLPTEVTVSLNIKDLYRAMSMSNFRTLRGVWNFINNTALFDFIGVYCGLNMRSSEIQKKLDLIGSLVADYVSDTADQAILYSADKVNTARTQILAGK